MAKDNHHFNPQGLLRGFTIQGEKSLVWEYDKETGKISRDKRSVTYICSQHHFYAQRDTYGELDSVSIENEFQKTEDKAIRIIRQLNIVPGQKRIQLSSEDKGILSLFISLLWARVPSFRDSVISSDQEKLNEAFKKIAPDQYESGSMPDEVKELYENGLLNRELINKIDVQHIHQATIGHACQNYVRIYEKIWTFFVPERGMSFVTSDNPVCFSLPHEYQASTDFLVALYHPMSDIFLALRKDLAVRCIPEAANYAVQKHFLEGKIFWLGTRATKSANKCIARVAHRYVYSDEKSDAFARMVGGQKGTEQKYSPESVPEIPVEISYDFRSAGKN